MATFNFKEFLTNFYTKSFEDNSIKGSGNFVSKINTCTSRQLQLEPNEVIVLPNGCYGSMSVNFDDETYSSCLKQFNPTKEQATAISRCVQGISPVRCFSGVTLEISIGGEIEYQKCCGDLTVIQLDAGSHKIYDCVVSESVKSYTKNGNGATIDTITYDRVVCKCEASV
jgi:hypothetical protein